MTEVQPIKRTTTLSLPQTKVFKARTALVLDMAGQRAGKSEMIGVLSGYMAKSFPKLRQFIGANTYLQLTQSTLVKCTEIWARLYGLTRYDRKTNPNGDYVIDKVPPPHFHRFQEYKEYYNIISFRSGHVIYTGSLDNYTAHEGKEFGVAHLDETAATKREALTAVITARLSQPGLRYDRDNKQALYWVEERPLRREELDSYRQATGHDFQFVTPEDVAGINLVEWRPLYVHTSPAVGTVDWLLDMFDLNGQERQIRDKVTQGSADFYYRCENDRTVVIFPTHFNEKNLGPEYLRTRALTLSENEYLRFVCGYPFSKSGGEYFPKFERTVHVQPWQYVKGSPLHFSIDYNYLPYIYGLTADIKFVDRWLVETTNAAGQPVYKKYDEEVPSSRPIRVMRIGVFKEYPVKPPDNNVDALCQAVIDDHPERVDMFLYGDATGKNHIAGMGRYTHFNRLITMFHKYLHNDSDRTPRANQSVMTRRDLINRVLEGKIPSVELFVDPSCVELIRDMEFLKLGASGKDGESGGKYKEIAHTPDGVPYQKLGHASDTLEYLVCPLVKHFVTVV